MQLVRFTDGGFGIYRIVNPGISMARFSAWYDAEGKLVECERIDRLGRAYPVASGAAIRPYLVALGLRNVGPRHAPLVAC